MITASGAMLLALIGLVRIANRPQIPLDDYPLAACTAISPAMGRVFFVDPERGTSDGDGSLERPWHDLQFLAEQGILGEYERSVSRIERARARLAGRPPVMALGARQMAVVRSGDTIMLASGDYGSVDLSGLVNRGFVTIAAAPDATPQLSSLDLSGASHFIFRGLRIAPRAATGPDTFLVTARPYPYGRPDNIVFDEIEVGGTVRVAQTDPATFAAQAPSGLQLSGDCLALENSAFHDLRNAVEVNRVRHTAIERNVIHDISVDGISFTGHHILIRDNLIFNQWPTPDKLHPDCMQGQNLRSEVLGPVTISHNACFQQLGQRAERPGGGQASDRFGFMGINIFNGRWRDVTVRCNLVMPRAQHGMGLYGLADSKVEHNVVLGTRDDLFGWIAVMPSKDGQHPENVMVRSNQSTGYVNAVHGGVLDPEAMIDFIRARRDDKSLMATLQQPITGVTLQQNQWLVPSDLQQPLLADSRFEWKVIAPIAVPYDRAEAFERYPLPAACGEAR